MVIWRSLRIRQRRCRACPRPVSHRLAAVWSAGRCARQGPANPFWVTAAAGVRRPTGTGDRAAWLDQAGAEGQPGQVSAAAAAGLFVAPVVIGAATRSAARFMPELIAGNSLAAVRPVAGFPWSPWLELGVVVLYPTALLAVGAWLLVHRDA